MEIMQNSECEKTTDIPKHLKDISMALEHLYDVEVRSERLREVFFGARDEETACTTEIYSMRGYSGSSFNVANITDVICNLIEGHSRMVNTTLKSCVDYVESGVFPHGIDGEKGVVGVPTTTPSMSPVQRVGEAFDLLERNNITLKCLVSAMEADRAKDLSGYAAIESPIGISYSAELTNFRDYISLTAEIIESYCRNMNDEIQLILSDVFAE